MADLTKLIDAIVRKRMETVLQNEPYDVVDVALMEEAFRVNVTETLTIANHMGFLGISDYLEGFEEGIKAEKTRTQKTKEKLDILWETVKHSEDTELKTVLLNILET